MKINASYLTCNLPLCIFKKKKKPKNQKQQQKNQTVGISNYTFGNLFLEHNLKQKNSLCTKYSLKCKFNGGNGIYLNSQ